MPHKKNHDSEKQASKTGHARDVVKIATKGLVIRKLKGKDHASVQAKSVRSHVQHDDNLMVSISGIRGIVGKSLTPEVIVKYATAFGNWAGGTIVVGRDSRVSGEMVRTLVHGALIACGCKVVDIGIVPTPTVEITVNDMDANGGIAITASHNPIEWNALKLIGLKGLFLNQTQMNEVLELAESPRPALATWDRVGKLQYYDHAIRNHMNRILELKYLDVEAIRRRRFKVVVDCVNGAGGLIAPLLLKDLGCDVIVINEEPHGVFPRNPEPSAANLKVLEDSVSNHYADVGFAVDPDVDRLAIVSNQGKAIGEELTLAIATDLVLSREVGPVVINASTTMAIEALAKKYGAPCFRTRIGEINVSTKMAEVGAVIGGEGNGGVIVPHVHLGRDACTGIALTLQWLLEKEIKLSEAILALPQFVMKKDKVELGHVDADGIMKAIIKDHSRERIDRTDGVRILLEDSWIHFRKSNTEPIMRIIAEARDERSLDKLILSFTSYFK